VRSTSTKKSAEVRKTSPKPKNKAFYVVGVGASAGGLEAFQQLLKSLPPESGLAFVLVQHLDPTHSSHLAEILSKSTQMAVQEVRESKRLKPNCVYVSPPNKHLSVEKGVLNLTKKKSSGSPSAIDSFFSSMAKDLGPRSIAVILSGAGTDGAAGLADVRSKGGITFAQNRTAKFQSMPRQAIDTGYVDYVVSPGEMGGILLQIARHQNVSDDDLEDAFPILKLKVGIDFSGYKKDTLRRRIQRRIILSKAPSSARYMQILKSDKAEAKILANDLLIKVTRFFRDLPVFQELENRIFPKLIRSRASGPLRSLPIKIWVPGCSTGEEVYSYAISLRECLANSESVPVQIFGTDVSEAAINKARAGLYSKSDLSSVSEVRLKKFFVKVGDRYKVHRELRDWCVFARQDVTTDPPFSAVDLISCRNLLIYFEPSLQKRVFPLLHYGLRAGGYLVMGSSESVGLFKELFEPIGKRSHIFVKKNSLERTTFKFKSYRSDESSQDLPGKSRLDKRAFGGNNFQRDVERALLDQGFSSGVVINSQQEIVQVLGQTGDFLEAPAGKTTESLMKMLRPGLKAGVYSAFREVTTKRRRVERKNLRFSLKSKKLVASIEAFPMEVGAAKLAHIVILFRIEAKVQKPSKLNERQGSRLQELAEDLAATQEYLEAAVGEEQRLNEELKTTNEKLMSSNEELQVTNEELETAKEELQSSNEELSTLNDELQERNHALSELKDDLDNLLTSVRLPTIMIDRSSRIRRMSPLALEVFNLKLSDVGRTLVKADGPLAAEILAELSRVVEDQSVVEREIQCSDGHWYSLMIRPYLDRDEKAVGAVAVLFDVDTLKREKEFSEAIIQSIREPLLVMDSALKVSFANECFYETFQMTPEETENRKIYDLGEGEWNISRLRLLLEEVLPQQRQLSDFEVTSDFSKIGRRSILFNARRIEQPASEKAQILLVMEDATNRLDAEAALKKTATDLLAVNEDLEQYAYIASHDLQEPLRTLSTYMELLVSRYEDRFDEAGRKLIDKVVKASKRMQDLVRELLHFSRTTTADLDLQVVSCSEVVKEVKVELDSLIQDSNAIVRFEDLPEVVTDRILVGEVLKNLIMNSIKFQGAEPPRIEISASQITHDGKKEWMFSIKDNGIGMEMQYHDQVFFVFQRLHSADEYSGSGIGLAVCRKIVSRLGGRIWFDSQLGGGTTFHFTMPVETTEDREEFRS